MTKILMQILEFPGKITANEKPSVYANEEELMALVDVGEYPIHVHQSAHKNCYGDVYEQAAAPIHLKFTPEKAAIGKTPEVPAHYDLLLVTLYPKTGDFVGIKFGRKKGIWPKFPTLTTAYQR